MEDEAWLWDELSQHSPSDVVTAAVLSYFWRESQYRSDAVAGWGMSLAGYGVDLCETVTAKTDAGLSDGSSRSWFIKKARRHGGYGLGNGTGRATSRISTTLPGSGARPSGMRRCNARSSSTPSSRTRPCGGG
jgi:hypothetical protein